MVRIRKLKLPNKKKGQLFLLEVFIALTVLVLLMVAIFQIELTTKPNYQDDLASIGFDALDSINKAGELKNLVFNGLTDELADSLDEALPENVLWRLTVENEAGESEVVRLYQGDYMKGDDQKRLFNFAFIQVKDDASYIDMSDQFKEDVAKIKEEVESAEVMNLNFRDAQTIRLQVGIAPKSQKFLFIRNRVYVAIPEHNAFMRFLFNDWVNIEDVDPLVRTYMNALCE